MADDTIARMGVELYTDTSAFVDGVEASLEQAKSRVDGLVGDIASTIQAGLEEAGISLGQWVAEGLAGVGPDVQEVTDFLAVMAEQTGKTAEELAGLAASYTDNLKGQMVEALVSANEELQRTNTLTPETIANLKMLADEAKKFAAVDPEMKKLADTVDSLSGKFAHLAPEVSDAAKETGGWLSQLKASKPLLAAADKLLGTIGLSVGSLVSGVALVTVAWKGLSAVMGEVSAAVNLGMQLAETNFRLEVSARAAQRALGEQAMSIKEAKTFSGELADTYGQSIVATTGLTAKAIQMTMEMGFSKDRVKELTEAAVVLNETIGMDSMSALMQISMFIQTGYGRALARQGFDVTRATQQQEAYALGINKTLKEMTEAEKQQVRTSLIMRQANKYAEDAVAGQENITKALALANREVERERENLAKLVTPIKAIIELMKKDFERFFVKLLSAAIATAVLAFSGWLATVWTVTKGVRDALTGQWKGIKAYGEVWQETFEGITSRAHKWIDTMNDAFGEGAGAAEDFATQVAMAMGEAEEMFGDSLDQFAEDAAELEKKLGDAIGDIWENYRKRYEQGEIDLAREIRDIDEDAAEQRLETIEEYQVEEIRMRQDHERRLKELENQYLFDLMDAVRERDALQVLMLQRRYNLARQKEEDEFAINRQRRKEDYERELRDIAEQAARKKAERERAFREEMDDLERQSIERRKELEAQYEKDIQALKDDIVAAGADIIQQLLAAGYSPEVVLEVAKRLGHNIGVTLGAGAANDFLAVVIPVITNALKAAAAAANYIKAIGKASVTTNVPGIGNVTGGASVTPYAPYTSPGSQKRILGFQTGGDFLATSPQLIRVGERPERVTISPLNEGTGAPRAGFKGGGGGKVSVGVGISLSAGLEGEIIDKAMSEVADVLVTLNRESASRPLGGAR